MCIRDSDNGIRTILNFGHTIGHALELKYGFNKIKHGEAVAYGMLSASYISFKLKKISKNKFSNSGVIRVVNPIKIAEYINIFHKPNLFINLGDEIVPINDAKV